MKRPLRPEEVQLWAKVAATVRPSAGRKPPKPTPESAALGQGLEQPLKKLERDAGGKPFLTLPQPTPATSPTKTKAPPKFPGKTPKAARNDLARSPSPVIGPRPPTPQPPDPIEPRRKRRIVREQELGPTLDLHGLDQDQARAALAGFLRRASEDGWRAVLVITGKGNLGVGILRRMTPEWLADPSLRDLVAGVSEAHRTHGGGGALYVALKRRPKR